MSAHTLTPLAQLFGAVIARDEADRAIEWAAMTANATRLRIGRDAFDHAEQCLSTRDGWDVDTLSHNIESNFPDLDADDCDDIALAAIAKAEGRS